MFKDNKKFVTETIFIKEALKKQLSLNEFLLLLYFDNSFDLVFDLDLISKALNMDSKSVLEAYGNLMSKKIIKVIADKDGFGKVTERVSLENFYNDIELNAKKKVQENEKKDIYSLFEDGFGRTLSVIDYGLINAWLEKDFSEDLIIAALNDAVYNGRPTLRYIDKILHEWNRKGIKSADEVKTKMTSDDSNDTDMFETSVLNFDWLNEK